MHARLVAPMRRTFLLAIGGVSLISGCATAPIEPKDVAIIQVQSPSGLYMVDGHLSFGSLFGIPWRFQRLTPGDHVIGFWCDSRDRVSSLGCLRVYRLSVETGHVYRFTSKPVEIGTLKSASTRLIDAGSGQDVGQMISASGAPLIESAPVQSPFFTLELPGEDGWFIRERSDIGVYAVKAGASEDELYSLTIRVFDMPLFAAREDLFNHLRKSGQSVDNSGRFEILVDSATPFDGRPDICVHTHRKSIDKNPPADPISHFLNSIGRKMGTIKPMIVERYGYVCRSPNNKNIAISFEYSHRSYEGQDDGTAFLRAEAAYARLKF